MTKYHVRTYQKIYTTLEVEAKSRDEVRDIVWEGDWDNLEVLEDCDGDVEIDDIWEVE